MLQLSAILSAVKPRDRSDQLKILAALFCLGAHSTPVTAKAIRELLTLQLGASAVPQNIPDRLRKYTSFADPAAKGPPIRWTLTAKGLDELRTRSGLALALAARDNEYQSDVGFVCALEHPELSALVEAFGGTSAWRDHTDTRLTHLYRESHYPIAPDMKLRLVATTSTSMGLTAAAIATTQLIFLFRPRLVIMVGIAAGTRSGGKQFGDILVADPSVDYNSGKVVESDGIREFQPDPYPIGLTPRFRTILQTYRGPTKVLNDITARWTGTKPSVANRLHIGPLGAADQVIDDASRVIEIQKNWRKLVGVEMETYGVYRACYESPEPKPRYLSFKSVCDFAAEKTDSWQDYAAFTAAQFSASFLRNHWNSLWLK
jgi:nucleoside phosphorylase